MTTVFARLRGDRRSAATFQTNFMMLAMAGSSVGPAVEAGVAARLYIDEKRRISRQATCWRHFIC